MNVGKGRTVELPQGSCASFRWVTRDGGGTTLFFGQQGATSKIWAHRSARDPNRGNSNVEPTYGNKRPYAMQNKVQWIACYGCNGETQMTMWLN